MTSPEPPARQVFDLQPLTEAEAQQWVAARDSAQADPVIAWRYLNDPVYHARVHMWEQLRAREEADRDQP